MQISTLKLKAQKHIFLFLSLTYFLFRLINLTRLPVFNDEAIYLDWAWRMTSEQGMLFYSLYDAKQPLLMWFFGIAMHLLPDPFFAGRFVSVLCGWLTLFGIYTLGKTYFNKRIAIVASFLYIAIPIFSFYDRQALMEAAVGAVGVWTVWFALKFWKTGSTKDAVFVGLLLGIGFFIKSSALIFLLAFFLISLWMYWSRRNFRFRSLFYSISSFLCVIFLILLQPRFWETLSSNSRYGFGLFDLLKFPVAAWFSNLFGNAEIGFLFLTPIVCIASIVGVFLILRKGTGDQKYLGLWVVCTLLLQILLIRGTSQRYLVSYLPLIVLSVGYCLEIVLKKQKQEMIGLVLSTILFVIPLGITVVQISNPVSYFQLFGFSRYSEGGSYITGNTSGYGVDVAIAYISKLPKGERIFVGESLYTGNPESAVMVAFAKSNTITVGYLDRKLLGDQVDSVDCIQADVPVYFMSKQNDVGGLEKFLENITYLKNPYNKNVIGIWKMKEKCEGKSLPVRLVNIK
ncbi:MAG: glycosyltransferase family 39 protein [bacterium]|nr:glycosyltransferase family 39 protein [bacterium]